MSADQFGKLYWDVKASLAARAILARVEYRCFSGSTCRPTEIVEADFMTSLGLGRTATRAAIAEAVEAGLVTRERTTRGDGRGVFVYFPSRLKSEPDTFANETRPVRKRDATRSQTDQPTFANKTTHVRKQDNSDPPAEPIEPKEPEEDPRAHSGSLIERGGLPDSIARLVANHESTWQLAMVDSWSRSLEQIVRELGLTAEQVAGVIEGWTSQRDAAQQQGSLARDLASGALPELRAVWWAKARPWLLGVLARQSQPLASPGRSWTLEADPCEVEA